MAKLYFRYGAMGCSKTANALMVAFNYEEKGLKPLVLKPKMENRDGAKIIKSRIGLSRECAFVEDYIFYDENETFNKVVEYDCIIVDEVQFCTVAQVEMLANIVNKLKVPVICYGLKTDFLLKMFPASQRLWELTNPTEREKLRTVCWCGDGAECNTRLDENGNVVRSGSQIMLGGNESYTSLCMKHYYAGNIGPKMRAKFQKDKK